MFDSTHIKSEYSMYRHISVLLLLFHFHLDPSYRCPPSQLLISSYQQAHERTERLFVLKSSSEIERRGPRNTRVRRSDRHRLGDTDMLYGFAHFERIRS